MKTLLPLILATLCSSAYADRLAFGQFYAHGPTIDSNNPGFETETICDLANRCETTNIDVSFSGGGATVSVSGSENNSGSPKSFGVGQVLFYFAVSGPDKNVPVPLVVSVSGAATVTGGANGGGKIEVDAPSTGMLASASFCTPFCGPSSVDGFLQISTLPNIFNGPNLDSIFVEASGGIPFGGPAVFSAVADPMVSFAPGFDSTGYSIVFSPDASTAVPEPSSVILLGLALLVLAAAPVRKLRVPKKLSQNWPSELRFSRHLGAG